MTTQPTPVEDEKKYIPPDNGSAPILGPLSILRDAKEAEMTKALGITRDDEIEEALDDIDAFEYLLQSIVANRYLAMMIAHATCERYDFCLINRRDLIALGEQAMGVRVK